MSVIVNKMFEFKASEIRIGVMCRLCMKCDKDYLNIFVSDAAREKDIWEVIRDLLNTEVVMGDGLPDAVCCECLRKLMEFNEFREMCLKSAAELRKSTRVAGLKIEEEEEEGNPSKLLVDEVSHMVELCIQDVSSERPVPGVVCVPIEMENLVDIKEEVDSNESLEESDYGRGFDASEERPLLDIAHDPLQIDVKEEFDCSNSLGEEESYGGENLGQDESRERAVNNAVRDPLEIGNLVGGCNMKKKGVEKNQICDRKEYACNHCAFKHNDVMENKVHTCGHNVNERTSVGKSPEEKNAHEGSSLKCTKVQLKSFKCETCGKSFAHKSSLMQHSALHMGLKPFKCQTCGKEFTQKCNLVTHLGVHKGLKPFKCETCGKDFAQKSKLVTHFVLHSGLKPFKCETCGNSFAHKSSLTQHLALHTGLKSFKCQVCGKEFAQKSNLVTHFALHSRLKPFKCETCGKSFAKKGNLVTHFALHSGLKPFECETCGKKFAKKGTLMIHFASHSGLKPFKCETCGKSFAHKSGLMQHSALHTGMKPFKCQACGKEFVQKCNLVTHLGVHRKLTLH